MCGARVSHLYTTTPHFLPQYVVTVVGKQSGSSNSPASNTIGFVTPAAG